MFAKAGILATLVSLISLALASPTSIKRAGTGSVNLVNNTPGDIPYAVVGQNGAGTVTSGTVSAGQTVNLPMSPSNAGYSVKLAGPGGNPMASSDILQLEYTYQSSNNEVYYDWSCVNCSPDPFAQYQRTIQPAQPSQSCTAITCQAGEDDTACEYTPSGSGPVIGCPVFDGVVFTATIG